MPEALVVFLEGNEPGACAHLWRAAEIKSPGNNPGWWGVWLMPSLEGSEERLEPDDDFLAMVGLCGGVEEIVVEHELEVVAAEKVVGADDPGVG